MMIELMSEEQRNKERTQWKKKFVLVPRKIEVYASHVTDAQVAKFLGARYQTQVPKPPIRFELWVWLDYILVRQVKHDILGPEDWRYDIKPYARYPRASDSE